MTFGALLKDITFQLGTAGATFWATLGKFGLLFTSMSGHTARGVDGNHKGSTCSLSPSV